MVALLATGLLTQGSHFGAVRVSAVSLASDLRARGCSLPVPSRIAQENSRGYTEIPREDLDMPASQPSLLLEQFRDC